MSSIFDHTRKTERKDRSPFLVPKQSPLLLRVKIYWCTMSGRDDPTPRMCCCSVLVSSSHSFFIPVPLVGLIRLPLLVPPDTFASTPVSLPNHTIPLMIVGSMA
ncbi:hypothetical protein KQX54_017875 [Cotesia glomerata]|uniref:Uncharacterized protein n=1 Tax=Cotesia glomerata TaxID=32391 RepID=A0AAV7J5K5_COTGL|nr:hypothetical protein KQX54_017875 [Cotesia glomerata]